MKPKTEKNRVRKPQEPSPAERPAEGAVTRALFIQATQALGAVLAFDYPADAVLSRHFRDNRELGHRDGAAFLIATHDERLTRRCDRVIALRDGVIATTDTEMPA